MEILLFVRMLGIIGEKISSHTTKQTESVPSQQTKNIGMGFMNLYAQCV